MRRSLPGRWRSDSKESSSESETESEDEKYSRTSFLFWQKKIARHRKRLLLLLLAYLCFVAILLRNAYEAYLESRLGTETRLFWEFHEPPQEHPPRSLVELSGRFPQTLGRCALIGGGSSLVGRGRGPEIDSYDTVIRVNRIPTELYFADVGRKTDVYFADAHHLFANGSCEYLVMGTGASIPCSLRPETSSSAAHAAERGCPFQLLVLKGSDVAEKPRPGKLWAEKFPLERPGWRPERTRIPVAHQSEGVNGAAYFFPALVRKHLFIWTRRRPTNGLQALLTFAPLCESLSLFGFAGNASADGHGMGGFHDFDGEHLLLARLAAGTLRDDEWLLDHEAPTGVSRWLRDRFQLLASRRAIRVI
eukprot:TRINITY_DN76485_c0_g1_i1.p1 TRINITY_DN76485_c0_g1~~TRINITY_DN76485_c0_g1_i1.p1  ORF type:complete len:363 (+),score=37.79 TRINITY_DN76485_c0_g1_i1:84-1172(+)